MKTQIKQIIVIALLGSTFTSMAANACPKGYVPAGPGMCRPGLGFNPCSKGYTPVGGTGFCRPAM